MLLFLGSCTKTDQTNIIIKEELNENDIDLRSSNDCNASLDVPYGDPDYVCSPFSTSFTTSFDDYPGCSFTIGYTGSDCTYIPNAYKHFFLGGYSLVSHDCPAYDLDVQNAAANGTLADFSKGFDKLMYDAVIEHIAETISFGWLAFLIDYQTASCKKYCYDIVNVEGTQLQFIVPNTIACGVGCCKYTTTVYYKGPVEGIQYYTEVATIDFADCDDLIPDAICKDAIYRTPCTFTCE